jgi:hypothetical protein
MREECKPADAIAYARRQLGVHRWRDLPCGDNSNSVQGSAVRQLMRATAKSRVEVRGCRAVSDPRGGLGATVYAQRPTRQVRHPCGQPGAP